MKVTKLKIVSYRGIAELETDIPAAGAVFSGGNRKGKTTCLNAIKACLTAQDVSSDAVRLGSERSEILINLDDHTVRRAISRNAPSKLTVERDGMKASKPTAYLTELLGTSSLDPLEFFLADAKKRKAQILAALPITVSLAQLRKYAPDLEDGFNVTGHGLEVVERARKFFYEERTLANREVTEAKATAERLAADAQKASAAVTPGPVVSADEARAAVTMAERELLTLEGRVQEAARAKDRTASQRERIESLRVEAERTERQAPAHVLVEPLTAAVAAADEIVRELETKLMAARSTLSSAQSALAKATKDNDALVRVLETAAGLRGQADALETALAAASASPPSDAEIAGAKARVDGARATLDRASLQGCALAAVEAAHAATAAFRGLESEAADLDQTVKRLANEAPTELLASAQGIAGLSIDGDDVLLDGKRLDALSGAEQLKLAVEIARRANAKSRILVVDGLERLDPEQMESFVAMATRDDWQLLASRVSAGDLVIESIEPDKHAAAAE